LATISVFGDIAGAFAELFGMVMDIISTFTGLKGLTQQLNMRTDLPGMMKSLELKEEFTAKKRKLVDRKEGDKTPRVDLLQIEVSDINYDLPNILHGVVADEPPTKMLFKDLNYTAPQGKIIAVAGKSGSGRKTFLEMLTMKRFPKSGTVFIPSHLRCVLISRDIILLNLSLWENLVFGNHKDNNPYRVEKILKHFGLTQVLAMCADDLQKRKKQFDKNQTRESGVVNDDEEEEGEKVEKENPMDKLRESEKAWIHLARGFVMNPEVIVMHRPFANFHGKANFDLLHETLKMHRDSRGLHMDPKGIHRRRPRTIIFSSDNKKAIEQTADMVWVLPQTPDGQGRQHENEHVVNGEANVDDDI
jgi:ABC-type nitrate/sulfonate/bicarbonate transport system ATPase subunit